MSPDTQDTEGRFHPWENDPLKRSLKSSSEPLEGTSESQVGDVSRDSVMPPVQKRKLDPLPKKHRHLRKVVRTKRKRKRKRKRKEKMETHRPGILPASLVRPQNEEDEVVDNKLTLLSAKEDGPDLPNKERLQSQQDEDTCVMHQEYPIQPCELSVSQELRPSSPAETSLASPPLCFGRFISCVCQTFSRSRKRKSGRESTKQAEGGGDAKAPRPGLLRVLGENRVEPH